MLTFMKIMCEICDQGFDRFCDRPICLGHVFQCIDYVLTDILAEPVRLEREQELTDDP